MSDTTLKDQVKERYAAVAQERGSCCAPAPSSVSCGTASEDRVGQKIGYTEQELASLPDGANLGLGCGNPLGLASVNEGDTVLDLGSGAGIDCFLAARRVGEKGHVIGVDMTPEMLEKARANAAKGGYSNVEFREGEVEALPVEDNSVEVVISNCVINLSPDKAAVFREVHRVLKPGGRFFVSDIVLLNPLPESIRNSEALFTACVSGALLKEDYLATIKAAGFDEVQVVDETTFPIELLSSDPNFANVKEDLKDIPEEDVRSASGSIASVKVEGRKALGPGLTCCGGA